MPSEPCGGGVREMRGGRRGVGGLVAAAEAAGARRWWGAARELGQKEMEAAAWRSGPRDSRYERPRVVLRGFGKKEEIRWGRDGGERNQSQLLIFIPMVSKNVIEGLLNLSHLTWRKTHRFAHQMPEVSVPLTA